MIRLQIHLFIIGCLFWATNPLLGIPPTITQCPTNITVNINTNNCDAVLPNMLASFQATDNCATPTTLTYAQSPVAGTTLSGHGTVQTVVFTVTDNCGVSSTCSATVTLKDLSAPSVLCHDKIVALVSGQATLTINDVLNNVSDNCTPSNLIALQLSKTNFTCLDLPLSPISVQLHATDAAGRTNFCNISINVQDNDNFCASSVTLSGKVKTENGVGISNVQMTVQNLGTTVTTYTTNATGNYSFPLLSGTNYTILLTKNINPLNGITTADTAAISNHIVAAPSLTSPYKIMAANLSEDDNSSSFVDLADLILAKQLFTGVIPTLPVSSWAFVPASHVFSSALPAFPTPQPTKPFVVNISATNLHYDFIGVKKGDADGDADPNQ
jgi:hypothetical protein